MIDTEIANFLRSKLTKGLTHDLKRNHRNIYDIVDNFCPIIKDYPYKQKIYWYLYLVHGIMKSHEEIYQFIH